LPEDALGTLSCKPSTFKKRFRKVINKAKWYWGANHYKINWIGVKWVKQSEVREVERSEATWSEVKICVLGNVFVVFVVVVFVFVVAGCIVYVLVLVISFIFVFYIVFFVCNVCYFSVVLLYYCHRVKAQLQYNKYIYIARPAQREGHPSFNPLGRAHTR
jgi:hypothetical protein